MAGSIQTLEFDSQILRRNSLGDPSLRRLSVYVPEGYEQGNRKYPTLFALASYPSSGYMMLYKKPFSESFEGRLDRLISSGALPPCLVVFPDCSTQWGGSQYINSEGTGRYEDYICKDVLNFVETHFRTINSPEARGVLGHSSGGYGAITLAWKNPDIFGSAACHAGDMGFEHCYLPDFPSVMISLEKAGGVATFVEKFFKKAKKKQDDFNVINTLAMAAAYSPQLNLPCGFELPFDLKTCELKADVWTRWLAHDPVRLVESLEANARKVKLFFDCGIFDEYRLFVGSRLLSKKMKEKNIDHVYEEFDDNHRDTGYRFERSLAFFGKQFQTLSS